MEWGIQAGIPGLPASREQGRDMGGLGCLRRTGRDLRPYKARKGHGYLPGTQGKRCEVWTRMRLGPTCRHPALPPGPRGHAQHPRDQASDVTATLPGPLQSRSPPTLEEDISPGGPPSPPLPLPLQAGAPRGRKPGGWTGCGRRGEACHVSSSVKVRVCRTALSMRLGLK